MTEKKLKLPLFYLANEEIQQKMERENSKYICYFEFSSSGLHHSQDKRVGISKKNSVILYPISIYILGK